MTFLPFQEFCQFLDGTGAVADLVLYTHTHLGKGLIVTLGLEDGVVAEALPSPTLLGNLAIDDTFEGGDLSVYSSRNDGAESCLAIVIIF